MKKIDLANKTALYRIAAKRGNWKNKRKLLVQTDSYFILSVPYYLSCYRKLSKDQNRENKALWKGQKRF